MSARDPIRSSSARQSNLMRDHYLFLSAIDYPLCLRSAEGDFLYSNAKFTEDVKGYEYNEKAWFEKLPIHVQLELLKCELELLANSDCVVLSKVFIDHSFECSVLFLKTILEGRVFASWLFIKGVIYTDSMILPESKKRFRGKELVNPVLVLEPNVYQTFCLFFSGFSHDFIAGILGVSVNATKKRISKSYQILDIGSKDEMILYLRAGSYFQNIHDTAFRIINERFRPHS